MSIVEATKLLITDLPDEIYDLALTASDRWIAVMKYSDRQSLSFNGNTVRLPETLRFPTIAAIDEETACVINVRTRKEGRNGRIITDSGKVIANFFAGDAIEDVFTTKNFLVVTYFDESALGNGIETNGIVAFDLQGTYQFGYRELFSTDAVDIADCYSACWVAGDRILFFPYTRFPLVTLDLHEQKQQVLETPAEVAGANAITSVGPNVYFHGPYDDPPGIYKWRIADTNAERIGEFPGHLRGLCKGRFLSVERNGYTILSIKE